MSSFLWLDYSERERRKMLEVIDLFKEHDTRDELGIGAVRDAFADQFFPGTSTIMTRARYFFLVQVALFRFAVNMNDIFRRAERKPTKKQIMNQTEHGCVRADPECQR